MNAVYEVVNKEMIRTNFARLARRLIVVIANLMDWRSSEFFLWLVGCERIPVPSMMRRLRVSAPKRIKIKDWR